MNLNKFLVQIRNFILNLFNFTLLYVIFNENLLNKLLTTDAKYFKLLFLFYRSFKCWLRFWDWYLGFWWWNLLLFCLLVIWWGWWNTIFIFLLRFFTVIFLRGIIALFLLSLLFLKYLRLFLFINCNLFFRVLGCWSQWRL